MTVEYLKLIKIDHENNIVQEEPLNSEGNVKDKVMDIVGQITEKEGERSYRLVYESPYFKLGCMATALGVFITLLCLGFFGYRRRRMEQEKRLRLDVIIREETDPFERSN
mgnify:CR=1 FL=1